MKEKLTKLFIERKFIEYFKELEEYLNEGYAVDLDIIIEYTKVLTYINKYDESYNLLKQIEEEALKCKQTSRIAWGYFINTKPKDTIRVLSQIKYLNDTDSYLLAKTYILDGNYKEAKNILNNILRDFPQTRIKNKIDELLQILSYQDKYSFMLEISYESFKEKDLTLQKGHIVYLKNNIFPNKPYTSLGYNKRPFLIYKIENGKLYLFPLTKKYINKTYVLKESKYPYIGFDRYIVPDIYITDISNVLSIKDKVYDYDFENALIYLTSKLYNSKNKEDKIVKDFYSEVNGKPKLFDVIVEYNPENNSRTFYFVIGYTIDGYKTVQIDFKTKEILSDIIIYDDNRLIYTVKKLSQEERSQVIENLDLNTSSLTLKK